MKVIYLSLIYFLGTIICVLYAQNISMTQDDLNQRSCFRFTWLGPEYDNTTVPNKTCEDILDEGNIKGIPCKYPLVVSANATVPDTTAMWDTPERGRFLCRQSRGKNCIKYTYLQNGIKQNITYMCGTVFVKGEGSIDNGCFKQKMGEYDVEMCVCSTPLGGSKPCNSSSSTRISPLVAGSALLIVWLIRQERRDLTNEALLE